MAPVTLERVKPGPTPASNTPPAKSSAPRPARGAAQRVGGASESTPIPRPGEPAAKPGAASAGTVSGKATGAGAGATSRASGSAAGKASDKASGKVVGKTSGTNPGTVPGAASSTDAGATAPGRTGAEGRGARPSSAPIQRPTERRTKRRKSSTARRRSATVMMIAALTGGVGAAAFSAAAPQGSTPVTPVPHQPGATATQKGTPAAFSPADTGECVTWTPGEGGINTNFSTVSCAEPHRFEVSSRQDLSTYPSSEFGPQAQPPDVKRQEELTAELCEGPTTQYLKGRLDPQGRYTISPILPPESAWRAGDRTMLCGVMVTDDAGKSVEVTGLAAQQDQSRFFQPDQCVAVEGASSKRVPCTEPHAWQVVSVVNLGERFTGGWPPTEAQNDYLNKVCTDAARTYLGGDDPLYYSTLTPFWTTLSQQSWDAGSRTVNCALTFGRDGGGFAALVGDARQSFTIDGKPPAKKPPRNPLRPAPPRP